MDEHQNNSLMKYFKIGHEFTFPKIVNDNLKMDGFSSKGDTQYS